MSDYGQYKAMSGYVSDKETLHFNVNVDKSVIDNLDAVSMSMLLTGALRLDLELKSVTHNKLNYEIVLVEQ